MPGKDEGVEAGKQLAIVITGINELMAKSGGKS
jgi:hypothetical protein